MGFMAMGVAKLPYEIGLVSVLLPETFFICGHGLPVLKACDGSGILHSSCAFLLISL